LYVDGFVVDEIVMWCVVEGLDVVLVYLCGCYLY